MRFFSRGDHVELADALIEELTSIGLSRFVDDAVLSRIIQSFAGSPVGENGGSQSHLLRINLGDVKSVIRLARDR